MRNIKSNPPEVDISWHRHPDGSWTAYYGVPGALVEIATLMPIRRKPHTEWSVNLIPEACTTPRQFPPGFTSLIKAKEWVRNEVNTRVWQTFRQDLVVWGRVFLRHLYLVNCKRCKGKGTFPCPHKKCGFMIWCPDCNGTGLVAKGAQRVRY